MNNNEVIKKYFEVENFDEIETILQDHTLKSNENYLFDFKVKNTPFHYLRSCGNNAPNCLEIASLFGSSPVDAVVDSFSNKATFHSESTTIYDVCLEHMQHEKPFGYYDGCSDCTRRYR